MVLGAGGGADGRGGMGSSTSLGKEDVRQNWPLICYVDKMLGVK